MFNSARLKLTLWYSLIIMLISICFSVIIYFLLTQELERGYRRMTVLYESRRQIDFITERPAILEPGSLEATENRVKLNLVYINLVILFISSAAGYFLAGRTLKPIQQMLDEQNRFITDASHELRTPLTSLRTEIEVFLRGKKYSQKETKQLLESNLEEVSSLQSLSDSLIKLTQFSRTNGNSFFAKVSIQEIIRESIKKVSGLAKYKQINIVSKVEDFKIEGEKQSLIEVFIILLENAIKYSAKKTNIKIESKIEGHALVISVIDQGIGISAEDLPLLFGRFYRADKARTKSSISGYGLGLSIAKQIIEKHKGEIKVISKVDHGSTFSVVLPFRA